MTARAACVAAAVIAACLPSALGFAPPALTAWRPRGHAVGPRQAAPPRAPRGLLGLRASGGGAGEDCGKAFEDMTQEELDALPDLMVPEGVESIEEIMQADNRFAFKMRALRGDFDLVGTEDTEAGTSLAQTLMAFPGLCPLKVVARKEGSVVQDLLASLEGFEGVQVEKHAAEEKMGGRFVSISIEACIASAEARTGALALLKSDPRVKMAF